MTGSSMSSSEWMLEILLMILLAATMFHAFRLERALGVLRRDRAALEGLVAGFNDSTRQAEGGIERLRAAADGAGRQIARHVDQARGLKSDLEFLTSRGEKIANQLEILVRSGRLGDAPPDLPAEVQPPVLASGLSGRGSSTDSAPRLRSQAEKDLLRALRSTR